MLFHSVYGLRPAVEEAAERLREAGHVVHVPDLYGGRVVDDVAEGRAIMEEIGRDELLSRAAKASAPHSEEGLVYAGFSLGAALAQTVGLADEKAKGLLLIHGTSDLTEDAETELPVQLHVADPDLYEPSDWLNSWYLEMRRAGADVEIFRYQGAGHLFTDSGLPDFDAHYAEQAWAIALDFLEEVG
ncbi:dienelactone hydrolase family protein [Actinocorallia sp. A-T 12471]|uniref:dienelactone hydrolase family protein n=1 Tax=Actinocorallia sp. A-T 12471 TaxID=3089813 RepID=UPI0029D13A21|nr:dienelactone hydrolase family protein [Actinocorallia sp. A-T 12471]MDX6742737.1 dienelactone hydrolase family protein [Actinocorallia sp. A-T 12471]